MKYQTSFYFYEGLYYQMTWKHLDVSAKGYIKLQRLGVALSAPTPVTRITNLLSAYCSSF